MAPKKSPFKKGKPEEEEKKPGEKGPKKPPFGRNRVSPKTTKKK